MPEAGRLGAALGALVTSLSAAGAIVVPAQPETASPTASGTWTDQDAAQLLIRTSAHPRFDPEEWEELVGARALILTAYHAAVAQSPSPQVAGQLTGARDHLLEGAPA